jgi:hypothetical protein
MIGLTIVVASCKEDSYETIVPLFYFTVKSHCCLFVYVLNTLGPDSICCLFLVTYPPWSARELDLKQDVFPIHEPFSLMVFWWLLALHKGHFCLALSTEHFGALIRSAPFHYHKYSPCAQKKRGAYSIVLLR